MVKDARLERCCGAIHLGFESLETLPLNPYNRDFEEIELQEYVKYVTNAYVIN